MAWALSQIATVGGRLNDYEKLKKTLVGVQWYSVHVSQPQDEIGTLLQKKQFSCTHTTP